jgi:hypothetical protein
MKNPGQQWAFAGMTVLARVSLNAIWYKRAECGFFMPFYKGRKER